MFENERHCGDFNVRPAICSETIIFPRVDVLI